MRIVAWVATKVTNGPAWVWLTFLVQLELELRLYVLYYQMKSPNVSAIFVACLCYLDCMHFLSFWDICHTVVSDVFHFLFRFSLFKCLNGQSYYMLWTCVMINAVIMKIKPVLILIIHMISQDCVNASLP